ncbi:phosphotransferase [Ferrimonas balearica]|uniref:phosphotransferase n=1 Tax=Ferrimonas balearica TaxID=44012 RepID=UPI001C998713|nr:phosphotransferase [Ferrimonas balearica]MBY5923297.1 capsular biosynthesis protein [Ferrimonas balearica]MBY5995255.1 capsular biosynthesis protein [Ferrimonas balearica]
MYLITSGAYVISELQSEFGAIPPAFLPVGNRRLFHHQLARIPADEPVVMTLPERFRPGSFDLEALRRRGVELLYLPESLSLGKAVVYALNLLELESSEPVRLLHGDTLLDTLPTGLDQVGISRVEENYDWAEYDGQTGLMKRYDVTKPPGSDLIVNGFFSFSKPRTLVREITAAGGDFIEGLNGYHRAVGLTPIENVDWYDFGHSHTYYQSKSRMTTQRAFNEMVIQGQVVTKASHKAHKLAAEANWYQSLPGAMKLYTPALLASEAQQEGFQYRIEYLYLTALNELYVFSRLPAFAWNKILRACCRFLDCARSHQVENRLTLHTLFTRKTEQRLAAFDAPCSLDEPMWINGQARPSIRALAQLSAAALPEDDGRQNLLHGDFCFSNILYDFRTGNIKVIDPRGLDGEGQVSIHGNSLYDIAKLSHSIIGLYDLIVAGYFQASLEGQSLTFAVARDPEREKVIEAFCELMASRYGLNRRQLSAMQIQLFLSMLPLHSDRPDRQLGFIGNAYRLYDQLNGAPA